MNFKWIFFCLLLMPFRVLEAQNAPVTTAPVYENALSGQDVTIPITVTGFNNIGSATLSMDYDFSKLHFVSGTQNPLLSGNFNVGDNDLGNGMHRIVLGWFGPGTSLPNGTWIANYVFTYISGTAPLEWYEIGPSCEYTDDNTNILNDIPSSSYYINGLICGTIGVPGTISGLTTVCQGQPAVAYTIPPLQNVTGYHWTVPAGATIVSGNNTNSISVDYSNNAVSGMVTVNGVNECGNSQASSLPVTVNSLPVANAGNDLTIPSGTSTTLHAASGGTGSYSYHWSPESLLVNPDVQNPQTVPLTTTTIFHLVVTSQGASCMNSDDVTIAISGGILSINPTVVPGHICRSSFAQLFANAGGGSGSYSYLWTSIPPGNPAWSSTLASPVVSPDSTTQFLVTVNDGISSVSGSTNLIVNQLPTAGISGGDSLCADGSMAVIRIDLTGIPPWSFTCTNGLTTNTISNQTTSPYLFVTSEPGVYTVASVTDEECTGITYGAAPVLVFPIPATPVIIQTGTSLISTAPTGNQWYLNWAEIPGATEQTYTPTENGLYYDIVTVNGCNSDTSNTLDVVIDYTKHYSYNTFLVYPNPAKEHFNLKISGPPGEIMSIEVFSSYGRFLKKYEITGGPLFDEYRIERGNLESGVYLLKIKTEKESGIFKLVIL